MPPRGVSSFGWVVAGYAVAMAAAAGVLAACTLHPLAEVALADVLATIVVFGFSLGLRNASLYDPYWSVAPVAIGAVYASVPADVAPDPVRRWLVLALVTLWAVRLTANWATGWRGLLHEDWRYRDLAARTGAAWPVVSLLGVHLFPTVLVYLGCLPLWPALRSPAPLGPLDVLAAAVTLGAVTLELVADLQLRAFARRADALGVMDQGVWAWSRHPNYLGELGFWLGLYLFALAAGAPWTGIGFAAMVALFVGVSIPLMETRLRARRPGYAEVQRRIPALIPWKGPR